MNDTGQLRGPVRNTGGSEGSAPKAVHEAQAVAPGAQGTTHPAPVGAEGGPDGPRAEPPRLLGPIPPDEQAQENVFEPRTRGLSKCKS